LGLATLSCMQTCTAGQWMFLRPYIGFKGSHGKAGNLPPINFSSFK
jgi:hypothetical protein